MSSRTREINKITMAIIRISVKLMLLAPFDPFFYMKQ